MTATSQFAGTARAVDPDRFLTALFVPAARREGAFALIAFNDELVRAVEQPAARSGAGPIAALIRLQWWREVVRGERDDGRRHAVAASIRTLLESGGVGAATLEGIVAAREAEADGLETLPGWRDAMLGGPGGLQQALGELLGVPAEASAMLAAVGAAYGCGALHRNLPTVLRSGRCPLPDEMLAAAGTERAAVLQDPSPARLAPLAAALAHEGRRFQEQAGVPRLPRSQIATILPLQLARRDLRRPMLPTSSGRGLGDRLAVLRGYVGPGRRAEHAVA